MSDRPSRRITQPHLIARYWESLEAKPFGDVIESSPKCFRCGRDRESWDCLERAHLVDRSGGGLDGPQNLVMLCHSCHSDMPSFLAGEELFAIWWVARTNYLDSIHAELLKMFGTQDNLDNLLATAMRVMEGKYESVR